MKKMRTLLAAISTAILMSMTMVTLSPFGAENTAMESEVNANTSDDHSDETNSDATDNTSDNMEVESTSSDVSDEKESSKNQNNDSFNTEDKIVNDVETVVIDNNTSSVTKEETEEVTVEVEEDQYFDIATDDTDITVSVDTEVVPSDNDDTVIIEEEENTDVVSDDNHETVIIDSENNDKENEVIFNTEDKIVTDIETIVIPTVPDTSTDVTVDDDEPDSEITVEVIPNEPETPEEPETPDEPEEKPDRPHVDGGNSGGPHDPGNDVDHGPGVEIIPEPEPIEEVSSAPAPTPAPQPEVVSTPAPAPAPAPTPKSTPLPKTGESDIYLIMFAVGLIGMIAAAVSSHKNNISSMEVNNDVIENMINGIVVSDSCKFHVFNVTNDIIHDVTRYIKNIFYKFNPHSLCKRTFACGVNHLLC